MKLLAAFLLLAGSAWGQCTGYNHPIIAQFEQVTGALTSYPAVISVTDSRLATLANGGFSLSTGFDICISDLANTTSFPVQLFTGAYNAATGAYVAAVQVSSLSASAKTNVTVWVGKASVSDPSSTSVWPAAWKQVYHLQENAGNSPCAVNGTPSASLFQDATSNAKHSTGGKCPTQVAGAIGNAQSLASASSQFLQFVNNLTSGTTGSLSAWIKAGADTGSAIYYENRAANSDGCAIYITTSTGRNSSYCNSLGGPVTGANLFSDGIWHLATLTLSAGVVTGYLDGVSQGTASGTFVGFAAGNSFVGHDYTGAAFYNGSIQEVRVNNTARSLADIKAEYDSMHSPSTFFATISTAGPTISAVAYTNLSAYSAVFTWTTSGNADSQVLCGANAGSSGGPYTSYSTQTSDPVTLLVSDNWGVTSHRLGINLPASYSGHCIVRSMNQAGGYTDSADQTVTTPAAPTNIPIGIASVSPRINLTTGSTGYSGDIDLMAATADGQWIMANNDSNGRAISSTQYCCDAHMLLSKWTSQTAWSQMQLGQDSSTPGSLINNVNGTNSGAQGGSFWPISGGSCATNVATVTIQNRGYTIPVGTPIWVAGVTPSTYNVSNVAITASTATTVTYTGTCGNNAWSSGGTVAVWNDGVGQVTLGIDSVNGLVCFNTYRSVAPYANAEICSTDYFAHSFNNQHNAPGGATTVANIDMHLPSTPSFFAAGLPAGQLQIVPCRDYGGANQNTFTCTWLGGTENYIYYVGTLTQATSGYHLFREAYADHKRVDATTRQVYNCAAANDDRGLYNNCWQNDLTGGTNLNSTIATYGNSFTIITAPDFNGFVASNWTALAGTVPTGNVSQSAGATLYDLGAWPWGIATAIGSVNRDQTDLGYFPTWSFLVPASYATVSASAPYRATVQLRQSGSYLNITTNPTTNKYGPNLYTISLAQRRTPAEPGNGGQGGAGPRFSYGAAKRNTFDRNGLDLLYVFQDPTGTRVVTNSAPGDTLGTYGTTVAQTLIQLIDNYGLFSPGFAVDGKYGAAGTHGYPFFITTPYTTPPNGTDFTLAVVFSHQDSANTGPPSGECVINRTNLKICRNGTTANSWIVTVGATASGNLAITCDAGTFCGVIVNRVNGSAKVYKTDGVQPNTYPLTVLATIADATALGSDALIVGAKSDGTLQFQGWVSLVGMWSYATNTGMTDNQLIQLAGAMRTFESVRGITLP